MERIYMERVYWVTGFYNRSEKIYDNLDEAISACKKYNKKAKNKRWVMSGIPLDPGTIHFTNVRKEYHE